MFMEKGVPLPFNGVEVLSASSDKAKLFAKNFSKNSYLDDLGFSLPVLLSRTNLKLHISVTPKMVEKVIMNLIHQKCLVLIVFQWLFQRTVGLNFIHTS